MKWQGTCLRWNLHDPVEASRHPLGIIIIVIVIVLVWRVLLGPSLMPRLSPMLLERLPGEILPFFPSSSPCLAQSCASWQR